MRMAKSALYDAGLEIHLPALRILHFLFGYTAIGNLALKEEDLQAAKRFVRTIKSLRRLCSGHGLHCGRTI
jgi:hypothetical protein